MGDRGLGEALHDWLQCRTADDAERLPQQFPVVSDVGL
jgi:hypothetical protein